MILVQAILTDRSENEDVEKLNNLLKIYKETMDPSIKKHRKEFATAAKQTMPEMFEQFEKFTKELEGGGRNS